MKKHFIAIITAFIFTAQSAFTAEKFGPNPGNLTPTGSQSVSLFTGAFTYSYPIQVLPGRNSMQPDLKLVYNSQAGNGWLGMGWDLSAGSIFRSTKNGIPHYNDNDTFIFSLNGQSQELAPIGGGQYRSQIETAFIKFQKISASEWRAWDKKGTEYQFLGLVQKGAEYYLWDLVKVSDANGNKIEYTSYYEGNPPLCGGGQCAPAISPMVSEIKYVEKADGTYKNLIKINMEDRPDKQSNNRSGMEYKITKRLGSIEVLSEGALVKKYKMTYSLNKARCSQLTGIHEYGSDGSTALPPVTFEYNDEQNISYASHAVQETSSFHFSLGDFNGDGKSDTLHYRYLSDPQKDEIRVGIGSGDGRTFASSVWNEDECHVYPYQTLRVGDFNGDGKDDICYLWNEMLGVEDYSVYMLETKVAISNGSSAFSHYSTWASSFKMLTDEAKRTFRVGDFNGDQKCDVVYYQDGETWVGISNGSGLTYTKWASHHYGAFQRTIEGAVYDTFRVADVNGDNKSDIVYYNSNGTTWAGISNGHSFAFSQWSSDSFGDQPFKTFRIGDFNGDGLSDVVFYYWESGSSAHTWVGLNKGDGFQYAVWDINNSYFGIPFYNFMVGDFNGDGLSDTSFYVNVRYSGESFPRKGIVYGYSNGSNIEYQHLHRDYLLEWNPHPLGVGDFNNDGKNDVYYYAGSNAYGIPIITNLFSVLLDGSPGYSYVAVVSDEEPYAVKKIKTKYQGTVDLTYEPYRSGNREVLPLSIKVVKRMTVSDGMGNSVKTTYDYAGGLYDKTPWHKREFLGFAQVKTINPDNTCTQTKFLQNQSTYERGNNINVCKGKIHEQSMHKADGTELTKIQTSWGIAENISGIYFPYAARVDKYQDNKHTAMEYAYDSYGNITEQRTLGDATDPSDDKITITEYAYNTDKHIVSLPKHTETQRHNGSTASQTWYYYDRNFSWNDAPLKGSLTRTDQWLEGAEHNIVSTKAYDEYGNLTEQWEPRINDPDDLQGNHIHTEYDPVYRQYPISIIQGYGTQDFTETYDYYYETGQIKTHTNINDQTTEYQYDNFGRLTKVIGPNDTDTQPTTQYQYFINDTPPHRVYQETRIHHGSNDVLKTYTFLDGLGRTIQTKQPAQAGYQTVTGEKTYNNLGQVTEEYASFLTPETDQRTPAPTNIPKSTYTYDKLGRITQITNPDQTTTNTSYNGWTKTITDANGHIKDYIHDAYNRIIQVKEHNNGEIYTTNYQYDALSNLIQITNNQLQMTNIGYDTLSRKTTMTDPQMGHWQYTYDANGNLKTQTDAKGQKTEIQYDNLSRIKEKKYLDPSQNITYIYDQGGASAYALGKLASVTDPSGTHTYSYDNLGRLITKTRNIESTQYQTQMTYDALGRETSLTYADGFVLKNNYANNVLQSITNSNQTQTYASLGYLTTHAGQLHTITYGNGAVTEHTYDPTMRRMTQIQTTANSVAIQNNLYGFDNAGNITSITDQINSLNTQTYTYDELNRLATAAGGYGTKTYEYNSIGHLTKNPENTNHAQGFENTDSLTAIQGDITSGYGRYGLGLALDGNDLIEINNTQDTGLHSQGMSMELWARPEQLGGGYILEKPGSYGFPRINADGSIDANIHLQDGTTSSLNIPNAANPNAWAHYVLTHDGQVMKIYINGEYKGQTPAQGQIASSAGNVRIGSGNYVGSIDEIQIHNKALTDTQIQTKYDMAPNYPPNQAHTPKPHPNPQARIGAPYTPVTFTFQAWDLDGDQLEYEIQWEDGATERTNPLPSGTTQNITHTYATEGSKQIKVRAIQTIGTHETAGAWSPVYNFYICEPVNARLQGPMLIGHNGGIMSNSSYTIRLTIGEPVVGTATDGKHKVTWGYIDPINESVTVPLNLGPEGQGNTEPLPPGKGAVSDFIHLPGATQNDIDAIVQGLKHNGYANPFLPNGTIDPDLKDANGNIRLIGNRWIKYDANNRPVKIITADGIIIDYIYDHEGHRVKKIVDGAETVYIGDLYEITPTETIKHIHAGDKRIASIGSVTGRKYIHTDHLGSTSVITDENGNKIQETSYTPFGSIWKTDSSLTDKLYTGHRHDSTGLIYAKARYYDPISARFITPDTLIPEPYNPQSLNRYSYCINNPVKHTDPTGHFYWNKLDLDSGFAIDRQMGLRGRKFQMNYMMRTTYNYPFRMNAFKYGMNHGRTSMSFNNGMRSRGFSGVNMPYFQSPYSPTFMDQAVNAFMAPGQFTVGTSLDLYNSATGIAADSSEWYKKRYDNTGELKYKVGEKLAGSLSPEAAPYTIAALAVGGTALHASKPFIVEGLKRGGALISPYISIGTLVPQSQRQEILSKTLFTLLQLNTKILSPLPKSIIFPLKDTSVQIMRILK